MSSDAAATFEQIRDKVHSGRRLSADDGQLLFSPAADLHASGSWPTWFAAVTTATRSITTSTPT